jgi:methionine synthase II (cobalamin-independent)
MITKNITVEDLVEKIPNSASFLRTKGLVCIQCGEPIWGTLEELAKSKGFSDKEISEMILDLNTMLNSSNSNPLN